MAHDAAGRQVIAQQGLAEDQKRRSRLFEHRQPQVEVLRISEFGIEPARGDNRIPAGDDTAGRDIALAVKADEGIGGFQETPFALVVAGGFAFSGQIIMGGEDMVRAFEAAHGAFQLFRQPFVVGIQESQPGLRRFGDGPVARRAGPLVVVGAENP